MTIDNDLVVLQRHAAQLSEHFDSVQIFATRRKADSTLSAIHGEGNWYARYGQVSRWVQQQEQEWDEEPDED